MNPWEKIGCKGNSVEEKLEAIVNKVAELMDKIDEIETEYRRFRLKMRNIHMR